MGEFSENVKSTANDAAGNTKQAIGKATDDPKLQQEGVEQEAKADMQEAKGDVEGAVGNDV